MVGGMRAKARQWSRSALALAALFASLPVAGRIVLGTWSFDGATGVAAICFIVGIYLHLVGRRGSPALPDPAAMLEEAIQLVAEGKIAKAIRLLTRAHRFSPDFWQAIELRGKLYLATGRIDAAIADFTAASALAPGEPQLRQLLEDARSRLCLGQ